MAAYEIVTTSIVLGSAVANSGTVNVNYPSGYTQSSFTSNNASANGQVVIGNNDVYLESASKISISYGASYATITNSSGGSWAAGASVTVGFARVATNNIVGKKAAAIVALTDNSGGTAADTIAAIGGTYSQAEVRNAVASLAAKINALQAAVKAAGVTA